MKQIIPFKKDIFFKTKIYDITSISLEHKVEIKKRNVFLEFIISGEYIMTESSLNKESFSYNLPFEVDIDKKYDISNIDVDIDDFYYEIINNEILRVNISVMLDKLEIEDIVVDQEKINLEKFAEPAEATIFDIEDENTDDLRNDIINNDFELIDEGEVENIMIKNSDVMINEENLNNAIETVDINESHDENKIINSIFNNLIMEETFKTYHIYIMREEDTVEKILLKYNITKEQLEEYNNIDNIKIGDKIIIPSID